MNWNKSSPRAQEDFKKLKDVKGSLKARWDGARDNLDELDLEEEEEELELAGLEPSAAWDRRTQPREARKGWRDWSGALSAQLSH